MGLLLYVADLISQIQLNLTTGRRNHWIIFSHSTQVCFFTLSKRPSLNVLLTIPPISYPQSMISEEPLDNILPFHSSLFLYLIQKAKSKCSPYPPHISNSSRSIN